MQNYFEGTEHKSHPITRLNVCFGQVVLEPSLQIRIERKNTSTDVLEVVGYYEDIEPRFTWTQAKFDSEWSRKAREVDDVFDAWTRAFERPDPTVKANWTAASDDSGFTRRTDCLPDGSAIVKAAGKQIARIYKRRDGGAEWVAI